MHFRPLTHADFDAVFAAFTDAFSDYVVPLKPSPEQLREMFTRRGWAPELSVGVFDDDRLVAFTLNGIDGPTAYDTGTGVVPTHRRRGLGRQMIDWLLPRLREAGCTRWILEVLEANHAAKQLYLDGGFTIARRLQCWSYAAGSSQPAALRDEIRELAAASCERFHDVEPSWQNSSASIRRSRDPHVVIGVPDVACAVVYPSNGDVPQLSVRKDQRRRGLGRALLDTCAARAGKPLRLMNIDDRDAGIAAFLERCGATRTVAQFEMVRDLADAP